LSDESKITKITLTRKEAAAYLGIHTNSLDNHTEIPRLRIGRKVLFRKDTLDKYLSEKESGELGVLQYARSN